MATTIVLAMLILVGIMAATVAVIAIRRPKWRAISPSGSITLGTSNFHKALALVAAVGKPAHVDHEHHIIFYDTQHGGVLPKGLES